MARPFVIASSLSPQVPMAEPIPLLHLPIAQPTAVQHGLFPIGDGIAIPAGWEPKASAYHPHAIPTPFSRAEATRLVMGASLGDPEAQDHPLYLGFKWLLLGVVAGIVRVEPADLESDDFDNLGSALLQVDPQARYLGVLRDAQSLAPLGATYRSCLFWLGARVDDVALNALAARVRPNLERATTLLADWRAALERKKLWNPEVVDWQAGVNSVLGDASPSPDLGELGANAAMVGPVWLEVPTGDATAPKRCEPIYVPVLSPDLAKRFIGLCRFPPRVETSEAGRFIVFRDARGAQGDALARIPLPSGGARSDALAVGGGTLELLPAPVQLSPVSERLHLDGPEGLVELLTPIRAVLAERGREVDRANVEACPPLYPDPIRILKRAGLWADQGAAAVLHSTQARLKLAQSGLALPGPDAAREQGGAALSLGDGGSIVFVEGVGKVEVFDLRALGYVLWSVFIGAVESSEGTLIDFDSGAPVMAAKGGHPLEPEAAVYERVAGSPDREAAQRLATLQRFVASYSGKTGPASTLGQAASAFATWAYGLPVLASGRVGAPEVRFRVRDVELALFRDTMGRPPER